MQSLTQTKVNTGDDECGMFSHSTFLSRTQSTLKLVLKTEMTLSSCYLAEEGGSKVKK